MNPFILMFLVACETGVVVDDKVDPEQETGSDSDDQLQPQDEDGDGYTLSEGDCDDLDASVNAGSTEVCDGKDNNCDDLVDEGVTQIFFADADGDGFGNRDVWVASCEQTAGYLPNDEDCDDNNPGNFPGNIESCNAADDDCDGLIDEEAAGAATWFADADRDGYGDPADAIDSCEAVSGRVSTATDCDDTNDAIHPDAPEWCNTVDDDCDGAIDEEDAIDMLSWYVDVDGDGFGTADATATGCTAPDGYVATADDCDDTDTTYHPGASESDCADPNDYNCDGSVAYADIDGDGWAACTECDDLNPAANPRLPEVCDGADNDCDGTVDEPDATDVSAWYADTDADLFGDPSTAQAACTQPLGYVADSTDCDDANAAANPGEIEFCNGFDDDCDSEIDEAEADGAATWYADSDADSYGDATSTIVACEAPTGFVADATDCDDTRALTHPGATEYCNAEDDDCDGAIDEGAVDALTYWLDDDGDGFGDAAIQQEACSTPAGYVRDDDDCDDNNPAVSPSATESCNGVDDNCNGLADDGLPVETWYSDADSDGYGSIADTGCDAPADAADNAWDCNDANAAIYPGSDISCPWPSCLDLLADNIATTSGNYWIDFDGTPTQTECDQTTDSGGWTLVYAEDFESAADPGWNISGRYACGIWSTMLGGYNIMSGGSLTNTLSTYAISHTEAWVQLDYAKLDSWDGELAKVSVDGTTIWNANLYYYQGSEVCAWNRGWSGSYDELHEISEMTPHSAGSVLLSASSTLDQNAGDESFGIDNLELWIR